MQRSATGKANRRRQYKQYGKANRRRGHFVSASIR